MRYYVTETNIRMRVLVSIRVSVWHYEHSDPIQQLVHRGRATHELWAGLT